MVKINLSVKIVSFFIFYGICQAVMIGVKKRSLPSHIPPAQPEVLVRPPEISPERREEVQKLRAVYINLDHRPDRKENVEAILNKYEIPHRRFRAINGMEFKSYIHEGKPLSFEFLNGTAFHPDYLKPYAWSGDRHYGRIGCWQSHVQLWLSIIEDVELRGLSDGPVLILEDDITWNQDFGRQGLIEHLSQLPDDWEMMAYGLTAMRPMKLLNAPRLPQEVFRIVQGIRAHAYVIRNSSVAKKLLSVLNTKMPQVIDVSWNIAFEKHLVAHGSNGFIVQHLNFGSDIVDSGVNFRPIEPFWHKPSSRRNRRQ